MTMKVLVKSVPEKEDFSTEDGWSRNGGRDCMNLKVVSKNGQENQASWHGQGMKGELRSLSQAKTS